MTAAGIALIAGGLATLIGFRRALWNGGGRRRQRAPRAIEPRRHAALTAGPATAESETAGPATSGPATADPAPLGSVAVGPATARQVTVAGAVPSVRTVRPALPASEGPPSIGGGEPAELSDVESGHVPAPRGFLRGRRRRSRTVGSTIADPGLAVLDDDDADRETDAPIVRSGLASLGLADDEDAEPGDDDPGRHETDDHG